MSAEGRPWTAVIPQPRQFPNIEQGYTRQPARDGQDRRVARSSISLGSARPKRWKGTSSCRHPSLHDDIVRNLNSAPKWEQVSTGLPRGALLTLLIEHFVAFIQDKVLELVHLEVALSYQLHYPSGATHDDVWRVIPQRLALF